jgi:hypothetical protein
LVVFYTFVRFLLRRKKKQAARGEPVDELPEYAAWEGVSRWSALLPIIERTRGKRPESLPALAWVRGFEDWPPALRDQAAALVSDHYRRRFGIRGSDALPEDSGLVQAEDIVRRHLGHS